MTDRPSLLLKLPLELRDAIYEFASARPTGSDLILKEYLEKIDQSIDRLPPHAAATMNTSGDANAEVDAVQSGNEDEDEDAEDESMGIADDQPDAEQDHEDEDNATSTGLDSQMTDLEPTTASSANPVITTAEVEAAAQSDNTASDNTELQGATDHDMTASDDLDSAAASADDDEEDGEEQDGEDLEDEDDDDDEDGDEDQDGDDDDQDEESDEDSEDGADQDGAGTAPAPVRAARSYGRNTKYRHMLQTIQLSHCPPPKELLQLCPQIKMEATQQFRDRCVLTINVNQGFQHMSFFTETLNKLIDAPYSPLEQVRKLRLVIAWDSEWLREKTTPPDREIEEGQTFFFTYYFGERLQVATNLVKACPELVKVTIEYHDTEDTTESRTFMADRLSELQTELASKFSINKEGFPLPVELEFKEHFSQAGTAHARNSVLALHRTEMDRFLQSGLDMR